MGPPPSAEASYSGAVPPEQLQSLLEVTDALIHALSTGNRQTVLDTLARELRRLLEVEACSIYLVHDELPDRLLLEACETNREEYELRRLERLISDRDGCGLAAYVAATGQLLRLNSREIDLSHKVTTRVPRHVASEKAFSFLGLPLRDRAGRLRGVITLDNKMARPGMPLPLLEFTSNDELLAKVVARKATLVLDTLQTTRALERIATLGHDALHREQVLDEILKHGLTLLGAYRGDVAVFEERLGDLLIVSSFGPVNLPVGTSVPAPSVIRQVWEQPTPRAVPIPDVDQHPGYYPADLDTRSELAVRLEIAGRRLGVLNIEWREPVTFEPWILEVLMMLSRHAALAIEISRRETQFNTLIDSLGDLKPSEAPIFADIVKTIFAQYRFQGALVYVADHQAEELRCVRYDDEPELLPVKCAEYNYRFDSVSLVAECFRLQNPVFAPEPRTDPRVDPKGPRDFQFDGPMLGLPLIHQERVIGALVLWSRVPGVPDDAVERALLPFARLTSLALAMNQAEQQRSKALDELSSQFKQTQLDPDERRLVNRLLQIVPSLGFDRGFLYRYDPAGKTFRFLGSTVANFVAPSKVISADQDPYAGRVMNWITHDPAATKIDPRVLVFPRRGDTPPATLSPTLEQPWAVVSFTPAGEIWGIVVADNAPSQRPITKELLDYLTLLGATGSYGLSAARTLRLMSAEAIPMLYEGLGSVANEAEMVERMLLCLVSGSTFGFSRALFLEEDAAHQRYVFGQAVGPSTENSYRDWYREYGDYTTADMLQRSPRAASSKLVAALQGYAVPVREVQDLLRDRAGEAETCTLRTLPRGSALLELANRTGAQVVIAVPVTVEGSAGGLLILDRAWQQTPISERDRTAAGFFARQMGQLLRLIQLQEHVIQHRIVDRLGMATAGLTHQLRQPVGVVQKDLENLRDAMEEGDRAKQDACLQRIQTSGEEMAETLLALQHYLKPQTGRALVLLPPLLKELAQLWVVPFADLGVQLEVDCQEDLPQLTALPSLLRQALVIMLDNAFRALLSYSTQEKRIQIFACVDGDYLRLGVIDNGPGIPPDLMARIRQGGGRVTRANAQGWGWGLEFCRQIAQLHRGELELTSEVAQGTEVWMRIPILEESHGTQDPDC